MLNQDFQVGRKLIPYSISFEQNEAEMSLTEHLEEVRQRAFWSLTLLVAAVFSCLFTVKNIVKLLQEPATGIKFLQLAPGEYFFASLKVAVYTAFFLSGPFIIYQIILFILPGMTRGERKTILPVVVGSVILFIFGIACGYFLLAPAALNFFINYGSDVVEPFWSFEQYFEFILVLLFSTGLAFQLPVIQVVLGVLKIVSSRLMFSVWRYVTLGATIIGAILTPSVDPVTQLFMSSIIMILYFGGAGIVFLIERSQENIDYEEKF